MAFEPDPTLLNSTSSDLCHGSSTVCSQLDKCSFTFSFQSKFWFHSGNDSLLVYLILSKHDLQKFFSECSVKNVGLPAFIKPYSKDGIPTRYNRLTILGPMIPMPILSLGGYFTLGRANWNDKRLPFFPHQKFKKLRYHLHSLLSVLLQRCKAFSQEGC